MTLFHITTAATWAAAQASGALSPASLASEGFVHCSTGAQVPGTLGRHFRGQRGLLLLRLDEAKLDPAKLRWEAPPGRPDERYPHYYAPLPVAAVVSTHPAEPDAQGNFASVGVPA